MQQKELTNLLEFTGKDPTKLVFEDELTSVYNRRFLFRFFESKISWENLSKDPLSLIMMDVDNFKGINDAFGHLAGDYVLRDLASCLRQSVRGSDIVARYGGDEFAVLLPETNAEEADAFMKRTLQQIEQHPFRWGTDKVGVGISFGISDTDELRADTNVSALLQRADSRLYQAKKKLCFVDPNGVRNTGGANRCESPI